VKTVRNLYVHLNGIFEFAVSKGWCHVNPCRAVDKPASPEDDDRLHAIAMTGALG
jgi:hypothetical protein